MLTPASCDFSTTSKALNFNMGQVNAGNFTGVNSVWPVKGAEADATLTATCDAGTSLNLKLSGTTVGTDDSVIALSQDSTAQGFGVQFLYAGTLMHINSTVSLHLEATETQFNLNSLVARYIQTSPQIKAGSANAAAVLTVTYD
jgi:type 1 fimbria pilin